MSKIESELTSWDKVRGELFTPEQIKEQDERVSRFVASANKDKKKEDE